MIETAGGMVMAVPANAFLKADGAAVSGKIRLCIKEALDALTIMSAGLSTTSGGALLETGGMFFIDARQGADMLRINPARAIYAEVPGDAAKPGMQLFSGRRAADGTIDWVKPVDLPRDLVPVDMMTLDFYPQSYLHLLQYDGYDVSNRPLTDSIYYSLAALFDVRAELSSETSAVPRERLLDVKRPDTTSSPAHDSVVSEAFPVCGINPAKIKAIRSGRYDNTLLATREFEQRLNLIHRSRTPALLDLYAANLDKSLAEIDGMAASESDGDIKKGFLQFAALRQGKVRAGDKQFDQLREYYARKTALFTEAIGVAARKTMAGQAALDNAAVRKIAAHAADNAARAQKIFSEELDINLNSAYAQLGLNRSPAGLQTAGGRIGVSIANTGWSNVDRYVTESTASRSTLDYTDPQSGRKAVIRYTPVSVTIADAKSYDRLLVYLLPDRLSSFISFNEAGGIFTQKLNGLMRHDLVCIGFKGGQRYYLHLAKVEPMPYDALRLKAIDTPALQQALGRWRIAEQGSAVMGELEYAIWELQNARAQKQRLKWEALMADLKKHLFACGA